MDFTQEEELPIMGPKRVQVIHEIQHFNHNSPLCFLHFFVHTFCFKLPIDMYSEPIRPKEIKISE